MAWGVRPRRKPKPVDTNDLLREEVPIRFARKMRQAPTASEWKLWQAIRRNQIEGAHFRRQHPIGPYVADFACLTLKLIIEVDGTSHLTAEQIEKDIRRTQFLNREGFKVIRFWNLDVLTNLGRVIERIDTEVRASIPPPRSGGG